jgi:uncharacterized protein YcfJ
MMNKYMMSMAGLLLLVLLLSGFAVAQDLMIYPAKGQSQDQMEQDKYQCYSWAKGQTGFDPMQVPTATQAPPQQEAQQGGVGRGAVRGGLVGLGVGAIAGDAGKGAAIGAASGGLIGGMRRHDQVRRQQQAEQQWANDQAANYSRRRSEYNRAYSACLEGRGYSVK